MTRRGHEQKPSPEMICILCPTGCRLRVRQSGEDTEIKGAACERGREYASSELLEPQRTFTGTVRVLDGDRPVVSVKSDRPVPRESLTDVARAVAHVTAQAPISAGDILADHLPQEAKLVATASVEVPAATGRNSSCMLHVKGVYS